MNGLHISKSGDKTFNIYPPDYIDRTDGKQYDLSDIVAALGHNEIVRVGFSQHDWVEFFRTYRGTLFRTCRMRESDENALLLTPEQLDEFNHQFKDKMRHLNETAFSILQGYLVFTYEHISDYSAPEDDEFDSL